LSGILPIQFTAPAPALATDTRGSWAGLKFSVPVSALAADTTATGGQVWHIRGGLDNNHLDTGGGTSGGGILFAIGSPLPAYIQGTVTSDYPRPENITVTVYKNGTAEYSAPVRANGTYKVNVLPGSGYTVKLDKHNNPGTSTPVASSSFNLAYDEHKTVDLTGEKPWYVTNFAGSGSGSAQAGDANTARFNSPAAMTFSDGFLYVVSSGSKAIMKVDINDGNTTILFQDNGLSNLNGIYADNMNNLYVGINSSAVSKIPIASPASPDSSFVTNFNSITDLVIAGNYMYVADYSVGHIKRVDFPSGGTAVNFGSSISSPNNVVAEGGFLYVGQYNGGIKKMQISDGSVTTLAGGSAGNQDGIGTSAQFTHIIYLIPDGAGNLYVTQENPAPVRKIEIATEKVTTLPLTGPGLPFAYSYGICMANGDIYVTDRNQHKIKKLTQNW
jgi:hypothetical protein